MWVNKVILTGGYFPFSFMYNDNINNLIESFAIVSHADSKHPLTRYV